MFREQCILAAWSSLVEADEGCIGPSSKLLSLWQTPKIIQYMPDIIAHMFESWANPVVHLLLLKRSMPTASGLAKRPKATLYDLLYDKICM